MGLLPYFPLANGLLTGKYRKGKPFPESSRGKDGFGPKVFTPENLEAVERLIAFAESRGRTILQLGLSWLAAHQAVSSVIAGAKTPEQARANSRAVSWKLSKEDLNAIDVALR
jgi:aryl-alcohol dehydrogenase-like predicted oxidoreductase